LLQLASTSSTEHGTRAHPAFNLLYCTTVDLHVSHPPQSYHSQSILHVFCNNRDPFPYPNIQIHHRIHPRLTPECKITTPIIQTPPQMMLPARPAIMIEDIIFALLPTIPPFGLVLVVQSGPLGMHQWCSVSFRLAVKLAVSSKLGTDSANGESLTGSSGMA
jgi:hypothetical protein